MLLTKMNEYASRMASARIPPHDEGVERGLLGSSLLDGNTIDLCHQKHIHAESFYLTKHRLIYEHLEQMHDEDLPIDLLTVRERFEEVGILDKIGGREYLEELLESTPTAAHAGYYCDIIYNKYVLRCLIAKAQSSIQDCYDPDKDASLVLSQAEENIFEIGQHRDSRVKPWDEALTDEMDEINHIMEGRKDATGILTGYADIDRLLQGLHKTDLIIIAARPSMGKTSLAMNIAEKISLMGDDNQDPIPVGIFSLEMSREQLVRRMIFSKARVSARCLIDHVTAENHAKLMQACDRLKTAEIHIDDTPSLEAPELRSRARRMKRQHDIKMIVVDYLQLMNYSKYGRENRQRETAAISGSLKAMAKELDVPVVVLSQLNRSPESRDGSPRLSDLRDSGSIEQDADVVCMLRLPGRYDDSVDESLAILDIAKHRNGETGEVKLSFLREYTRFEDRIEIEDNEMEYDESYI